MTRPLTRDTHAHYFPEPYLKLVAAHGKRCGTTVITDASGAAIIQVGLLLRTGPITSHFYDLDDRLKTMDRIGVRMHALSLTQPMVYWADDELGLGLCVAFNDAVSAAHRKHPDRFIGFACLPLQNARLALEELERAAKLPGIRGIYLVTAVRDRELSDRSFFPVYERAADLGLPIFLHPRDRCSPSCRSADRERRRASDTARGNSARACLWSAAASLRHLVTRHSSFVTAV